MEGENVDDVYLDGLQIENAARMFLDVLAAYVRKIEILVAAGIHESAANFNQLVEPLFPTT